jgi:hypothetical protein
VSERSCWTSAHVRILGRFLASGIRHMLIRLVCFRPFNSFEFFIPDFNHSAAAGRAYTWETNIRYHGGGINAINIEEGSRDCS